MLFWILAAFIGISIFVGVLAIGMMVWYAYVVDQVTKREG